MHRRLPAFSLRRAMSTNNGHIYQSFYPSLGKIQSDSTLSDFLLDKAKTFDQTRKCFVDGFTHESFTYGDVVAGINNTAVSLLQLGLKRGDVVAIMSPNNIQFPVAFHGIAKAGLVSTTVNPLYTDREVDHQLHTANAKAIIASPACIEAASRVARERNLPLIVFGDEKRQEGGGIISFSDMMRGGKSGEAPPRLVIDAKTEVCTLPFSSGTTGAPKGTMLSHYNLIANTLQSYPGEAAFFGPDPVQLCPLPLFHIYGICIGMNLPLHSGSTVVLMPRFDLPQFLSIIEKYKVKRAHVVPPIVLALSKHPIVDKYDLSSLESLLSGAAPLGVEIQQACQDRLNVRAKQGYGQTECSPICCIVPDDEATATSIKTSSSSSSPPVIGRKIVSKLGYAGCLAPDTDARLCHPETGEVLKKGETGELQIRGPQIMLGYLNNDKATKETLTPDGWLRTGDVCVIDEDGYIQIVDRCKELIKYKGFQVPPAELEDLLNSHPLVQDSIVIPVPCDEAGELPKAYVVLKAPTAASPSSSAPPTHTPESAAAILKEINVYISSRVAPHKKLRGGIVSASQLPKTASGKLLRRVVRAADEKARQEGKTGADM